MLLIYYRMYTSYGLLWYLFGLDAANVYRDIRYLEPAVKRCIPIPSKKYESAKKATTIQELEQYFPELKIIIDATEQSIPRSKDKCKRKIHYTGKKKRHTVTNQIRINLKGQIIHKPSHSPKQKSRLFHIQIKTSHSAWGVTDICWPWIPGNSEGLCRVSCRFTTQEKEGKRINRLSKGVQQDAV